MDKCIQEYANIDQQDQDWEALLQRDFPNAVRAETAFETYKKEFHVVQFMNELLLSRMSASIEASMDPTPMDWSIYE